jgi:pyocin large subunit-like protein
LHGEEFGHVTTVAYLRGAQRLTLGGAGVLTHRRLRGDTRFYEPATNSFAALAADGRTILTYFKPRGGAHYWQYLTRTR